MSDKVCKEAIKYRREWSLCDQQKEGWVFYSLHREIQRFQSRDKKVKRASMEGHTEQYFRGGRRSSCKRMSFSHQAKIRSRAC